MVKSTVPGSMQSDEGNDLALSRRNAISALGIGALASIAVSSAQAAEAPAAAKAAPPMVEPSTFYPYRALIDHPKFSWPNGARVAVFVVPNIEHFRIELDANPPDIRNYSRRDYGNRSGIWRLMETLTKHGMKGTVALNSEVARYYPRIMEEAVKLDWEFMGHGITNSIRMTGQTPDAERATIAEVRKVIEAHGQKMRGWLGPGLTETWNTLNFLKEAGVEYTCDWVNDDLPYKFNNGLYSIPYTLELNDIPLFNEPSVTPEHFEQRIRDAFDVLYAEGATMPRVMCIALHPFLIGSPHRIKYLDRALGYIRGHDKAWLAKGSDIIDAYRKATA
jgi:allantoinase